MKKTKIIKIREEVELTGTNITLEPGDRIRVISNEKFSRKRKVKEGVMKVAGRVSWYSWAASALINDDWSGLDSDDIRELGYFTDELNQEFGEDYTITMEEDDDSYFGRPDFGGKKGDLVEYTILTYR